MFDPDKLNYNSDGLIPAIVQDYATGRVLMMAYMNRESIDISMRERRACFWSRSRKRLWRKGETSGNILDIMSIATDCDADTLLIKAIAAGPACHTGAVSCFYEEVFREDGYLDFSLNGLYDLILNRKQEMTEGSYTTYLFQSGDDKILKKVGEESTEVIVAAKNDDREELIYEIADLTYHVIVLMAQKGITLADISRELAGRHVIDKKNKQSYKGE